LGDRLPDGLVDGVDDLLDLLDSRTPIEYSHPVRASQPNTLADQNPKSARKSLTPVAPARSTRAISSSQNRSMPFCVFADPFLSRMCSTSRVSDRLARIGSYPGTFVYPIVTEQLVELTDGGPLQPAAHLPRRSCRHRSPTVTRPARHMPEGERPQEPPARRRDRHPPTQQPSRAPSLSTSPRADPGLGLQPVAISAEVQRPKLVLALAHEVAFADKDLLSAVGLDALTTFAAKRSGEAPPAL
jgi:hypothetical protein